MNNWGCSTITGTVAWPHRARRVRVPPHVTPWLHDVSQLFTWPKSQGGETCRGAPGLEPAAPGLGRALGWTKCHSALSADVCFYSGLNRLRGKLAAFQSCPSLISSRRVENNSSYLCRCTSAQALFCLTGHGNLGPSQMWELLLWWPGGAMYVFPLPRVLTAPLSVVSWAPWAEPITAGLEFPA